MTSPYYPKRAQFFAHRFVRLLTKTAAAQELGPEACWMLTVIAHQEDAKRYSGPVTYFNEQLMPLCGFTSIGRLTRQRQRAIEQGWLHYESGGKGKPGKYWVRIPPNFLGLPDGGCDESVGISTSKMEMQDDLSIQNGSANGEETEGKRRESAQHSTLALNQYPKSCPEPAETDSRPAAGIDPFPVKGGSGQWVLAEHKAAEYHEAFGCDCIPELRRARQWLIDNPTRRKTANGMCRFLFSWLERANNRGGLARDGSKRSTPLPPLTPPARRARA